MPSGPSCKSHTIAGRYRGNADSGNTLSNAHATGRYTIAERHRGRWVRPMGSAVDLLNRREPFSDENPGEHKLLMSFAVSAGHCGAIALDVQEGRIKEGRVWQVSVSKLSEIREQRETERDPKRDQETRTYESHRAIILRNPEAISRRRMMSTIATLTRNLIAVLSADLEESVDQPGD